jgi:predicted nuclease of predicted toxin-antitoxin system
MKFLVDARLPMRLRDFLLAKEHDCVHTSELPNGNRTPDSELNRICATESRILVSKDADFVDSLILRDEPPQLLVMATGNISNTDLLDVFGKQLDSIINGFATCRWLELSRDRVIVHE